ncbi:MAG: phosphatidate cytidylyltransferase [Nitrospirales bacterium]|nr:phosphatidate cytidylyltransferase [Nitrospirales bacterium]
MPSDLPSPKKRIDSKRFYTAFGVIPFLYLGIAYSPPWLFSVFVGLTVLLALWEFLAMFFEHTRLGISHILCFSSAVGVLFLMHEHLTPHLLHWIGLGITLGILTGFLLIPFTMREFLPSWMGYGFGVLYIALLFGHFILIRQLPDGIAMVFFVLIVTWLSDTGGFVFGLTFGRHPLAPVLSPKKTIEGFLGGILFSLIGAVLCHLWFFSVMSLTQSAMMGILLAVCGTLGDLTESAIKRSVHVKDSGTLIPGHGGVLDRIDSLLLSAPAFYYYALFMELGL